MMLHGNRAILAIAILSALTVVLAACGGSGSNSDTGSAAAGGATVATKAIAGTGEVLVDSKGQALYTNDMDSRAKIACTGECLTEWLPLAAPSQAGPSSGDSAVQAKLGTIKRPDGGTQVTFGGLPLYTFVEDSPGAVTGDGFSDSFGGTHFVWTAATTGGGSSASPTPTTQGSPDGGYQY